MIVIIIKLIVLTYISSSLTYDYTTLLIFKTAFFCAVFIPECVFGQFACFYNLAMERNNCSGVYLNAHLFCTGLLFPCATDKTF